MAPIDHIARILALALLVGGCPGSMPGTGSADRKVVTKTDSSSSSTDYSVSIDRNKVDLHRGDTQPSDHLRPTDLPVTPGAPCASGKCGANLACVGNVCLKVCVPTNKTCNDKATACGATEACLWASGPSTSVCYMNMAGVRENCETVGCAGGSLCTAIDNDPAICLRLAKYGCASDETTGTTDTGCVVCVPYQ